MDLRDLGKAFTERALRQALGRAEVGDRAALDTLVSLGLEKIPAEKQVSLANQYYTLAKELIAGGDVARASVALEAAHRLQRDNQLYIERARLLREVVLPGSVKWRGSLHDLQRELAEICNRTPCICVSHFEIARCRGVLGEGFPAKQVVKGITIYSLGPYHSRSYRGKWTKLLKAVKHAPFDQRPLKPMADIAADFLRESTRVLAGVDVIVPIPPAPAKFNERGFAPNDIWANRLSLRCGVPVRKALLRRDGTATRDASDEELDEQFQVKTSVGRNLGGLSILLVEDIWTWGRTIPICAAKLLACGATDVEAIALGHTKG